MTLAGGSWLSLELAGSPCPSRVPPCQPSWAMGAQTTPHSPWQSAAPAGHREEWGCFSCCLRDQRFTGVWGLPSIAPGEAPALQVHPQPGSHGTAARRTPPASLVPQHSCGKPWHASELVRTLLGLSETTAAGWHCPCPLIPPLSLRVPCGAGEAGIRHAHIPSRIRAEATRRPLAPLRPWSCCCCCYRHHHRNFGSARGLLVPLPW